ncbi:KOW domain-containing RNA-binding protein [Alkalithermobacter paradoxus]|uniref:50S ribosomal protein L14e n=1 Tax=Alkalithermobacter paradoxus TaxID=29349 RepID=A0A1V4I4H3_9FIRM|nr:50S ribosomal protein L14e [[Clostridium] thermoalcaliphilum]
MDTNDINIGQVVVSKAGRDKGRPFFVLKIVNEEYVLVADGDLRKLENPKLKKIKHLIKLKKISQDLKDAISENEKINNAFLRSELKRLSL